MLRWLTLRNVKRNTINQVKLQPCFNFTIMLHKNQNFSLLPAPGWHDINRHGYNCFCNARIWPRLPEKLQDFGLPQFSESIPGAINATPACASSISGTVDLTRAKARTRGSSTKFDISCFHCGALFGLMDEDKPL